MIWSKIFSPTQILKWSTLNLFFCIREENISFSLSIKANFRNLVHLQKAAESGREHISLNAFFHVLWVLQIDDNLQLSEKLKKQIW